MSSFVAVPYGETCLSKGGIPVKKKLLSILLVPTMLAAALTVCASAEKSSDAAAAFNAEMKPAT